MADPGFPVGGGGGRRPVGGGGGVGGHQPPMCTLFGKNVCENERNGSCWGGGGATGAPLDPPMIPLVSLPLTTFCHFNMCSAV